MRSRERDALVLENMGLVRHILAAKFPELVRSPQFDDLVQAATVGLILAVDAYYFGDTPIRVSFSIYARTCIVSELQGCVTTTLTTLAPARERRERIAIRRRWTQLTKELGRDPTPSELRASWPSRAHKLGDKVIERALDQQPKLYFGLDASDAAYPQATFDSRIEERVEARRTLAELDALEPLERRLRLRRAV